MFKTLNEASVSNKRVLVRCDFNVPLRGLEIEDDFRIRESASTIDYLLKNKAKVILMSHFGDPGGKKDKKLSLEIIKKRLEGILGVKVKMLNDCIGKKAKNEVDKMKSGEVVLLENLRFYKEEKAGDENFAKELSRLGDIYVNDAFGASHRAHASITGIPKFLPSCAGFLLEKEIKVLSRVLEDPWRPLVVVIGGAKIESKTSVINSFFQKADHLLIGGKIGNSILAVRGISIGHPWPEPGCVKEIEKFDMTSSKLHLPIDALASPDNSGKAYVRNSAPGKVRKDELMLDIGPETIRIFCEIIKTAKMIVWSGPMGLFENSLFENGTKIIAEEIARNYKAFKIGGGGDTLAALSKFGLREKFDHISTGGGAMLEFLSGKKLPGIEALEKNG